ncbi:kelch 33 [Solea senegalensis]|uniref:Kelch 33 n=1 Tax=Solea senegalensis TaxID=28829 RepID=A0AAV6QV73_SOLSE|nr:kelch-like protein 22 [Solea senegalensis]KAG7497003.1 kelch 33 [Solea senegalensis]
MAVANPCFQKEGYEWTEVKNKTGRRWRERGRQRAKLEVNGEDGEEVEEGDGEEMEEDTGSEEVREEANEAGRNGEEEVEMNVDKEVGEEDTKEGEQLEDEQNEEDIAAQRNGTVDETDKNGEEEEGELETKREEVDDLEDGEEAGGNEAEVWEDRVEREVGGSQEGLDKELWEEEGEMEEEVEMNVDKEEEEEETTEGEQEEDDSNEQNVEDSADQRDGTIDEENLSDSAKSDHEDFDWRSEGDIDDSESDDDDDDDEEEEKASEKQSDDLKELDDLQEHSSTNESSIREAWTSTEEDVSEKLLDEEETATRSCSTHEEDFLDYQEEEEDSTDDEEAEHSLYEDVDCSDEGAMMKIFQEDDYPKDIFRTLTEFKDSFLLTDLIISTNDGKTFQVHSLVLAAVSSLIWETLSRGNMVYNVDGIKARNTISVGINTWSLCLGPEVDHVGLEAIVEFAYSGHVSQLNKDTMEQIKAAAQTLGAHRVMELCPEEGSTHTGEKKKEKRISAAEQMRISLQSIRQMWMDGVGCDVILDGIGKSLHVHRIILAASSDYFRGMFTLGMKESYQPRINLPFLLASELETLIGCSYSGALSLSWRCVFELTSTALQLQYQPALSLCLSFLQKEINPQSCLDVASFAAAYEMAHLLEVADDYVLRQFQKVACTLKFKDLPARQLLKYLNSRSLCVQSELVVFKAVVAWIQAKPKTRIRLTKELMKTINFPLMTFKEFNEVHSLNMWSEHSLDELYKTIFENFCSYETAPHSQYRIYLPKESLVLIGGDQITEDFGRRTISRELWFGNSLRNHTGVKKAMEWRRLGEMPEPARFSHEVAVIKGQLYVFGGKKYYGLGDTLNSVLRYNPNESSWESLPEMQEKRCFFSVVVLDGQIYAIGGHCEPEYRDSVERYCPATNSWSFTRPLDLPLTGHVAKVSQGQIFISGGVNDDYRCLATMFRYHPETGSAHLANMTRPRAYHCMEALGDCLYVAGGNTIDDHMTVVDQLTCEVYSPAVNTWTAFMSLPVPHVGAGSAVLEGKFYVLGGYSQEDYSDTKMVHRYDPTTQRWENIGKMPGPNNDIRACVLSLPEHLRLQHL